MSGLLHPVNWILELIQQRPAAGALLALSLVAFTGLALGNLRIRGIGLGIAGILFSGILFGHLGLAASHEVLEFARDAGLVLFVYTIGIQVGPGFVASLRREGLTLNLLAVAIVALGGLITVLIVRFGGVEVSVASGLFAGATTNTPALGAAQEALKSLAGLSREQLALPALGYAVSYPFGIIGIILSMLLLRAVFRVRVENESEALRKVSAVAPVERRTVVLENPELDGLSASRILAQVGKGVVFSRIRHGVGEVCGVQAGTKIHRGDVILTVGIKECIDAFVQKAGRVVEEDLRKAPGRVHFRRVIVTRNDVLGKSLGELSLEENYSVTVTRLTRANVELAADADQRFQFGDQLHVVGEEGALDAVATALGNSIKALNVTDLLPVLLGIAVGIFLGNIPIPVPGMPAPVTLGIAGGPLLVAIVLSRVGCIGSLRWYMPTSVNTALRELGIAVFLASVGLMAGSRFFDVLVHGDGLVWMAYGTAITLVPLLLVGAGARVFLKLNFAKICGLLAGSMTDPPALAFANTIAKSDMPSVTYATVYPLTMTLRILLVQAIVLWLAS